MLSSAETLRRKIVWALDVRGIKPAELVAATQVKSRSAINSWRNTGRIDKRHLVTLAALTGTTPAWWIEHDAPIPPTGRWLTDPLHAGEPTSSPPYLHIHSATWPFRTIADFTRARFDALGPEQKARVEAGAFAILLLCEAETRGREARARSRKSGRGG